MPKPEVMLLAGPPGIGKSSIANRTQQDRPDRFSHLDIGDLKRGIVAGLIPSVWRDRLMEVEHPDRKTGAAPSEAMTGIAEEFILERPGLTVIIGGFPRYEDRVAPFKESMKKIDATILGVVMVELVPNEELVKRMDERAAQEGPRKQKIQDPYERLADHEANIVPVIEGLAADYGRYILDGRMPVDVNAYTLASYCSVARDKLSE